MRQQIVILSIGLVFAAACKKKEPADKVDPQSIESLQTGRAESLARRCGPPVTGDSAEAARDAAFAAAPEGLLSGFNVAEDVELRPEREVIDRCEAAFKKAQEVAGDSFAGVKLNVDKSLFRGCWILTERESNKQFRPVLWLINNSPAHQEIHSFALYLLARAVSDFGVDIDGPRILAEQPPTISEEQRADLDRRLQDFKKNRRDLASAVFEDLKRAKAGLDPYKLAFGTDNRDELIASPFFQGFVLGQTVDAFYCNLESHSALTDDKGAFPKTAKAFRFFAELWGKPKLLVPGGN
jgi:hypothetical protein